MKDNFEVESVSEGNILHTQFSKLVNYGAKLLKVAGPLLWNNLPDYIRNSESLFKLKSNLKKLFLEQYVTTPEPLSGHYYVSKMSLCCMKLTFSKMHTFFVPPYLPSKQCYVRKLSLCYMKITISSMHSFFVPPYLPANIPLVRIISKDGLRIKIFKRKKCM